MITVPITAQINSVDAPSGATLNTLNVDLRQQPNAGGFFNADVTATQVAAGSAPIPAVVSVLDAGGGNVDINVDFRQQANAGGFMQARVASGAIAYAGAAAPVAPTLGTAVSGALAGATYFVKTTYVDANGNESLASPEASQVVATNSVLTVTSPGASTGAVKWKVYISTAAGTEKLENGGAAINLGTNYQEPNTGLVGTGASVPTSNTLVAGACTVTITGSTPLAAGAAVATITQ